MDWLLGVQSLIPLSQFYISVGSLHWQRANMKIDQMALKSPYSTNRQKIWLELITGQCGSCV